MAEGPVTTVRPYDPEVELLAMATRYLGDQDGRAANGQRTCLLAAAGCTQAGR